MAERPGVGQPFAATRRAPDAELSLRVGVFGGSFNPPHLAHRMIIAAALESDALDVVWMLPTFKHAFGKELAPYSDRVHMCRMLAAPFGSRVVVSDLEAELGGESRTLPLLERMVELLPLASFRLLIGADILAEAHKWYRWPDVARIAPPLVFGRAGEASSGAGASVEDQLTLPAISSTEIRTRLGAGHSVASLLPDRVVRYIVSRGLYGSRRP